MKRSFALIAAVTAAVLVGCSTSPPNADKATKGTVHYYLRVESSEPGVTIETNGVYAGKTPMRIEVFGEKDGTFHNFGSPEYVICALPLTTNQFRQTQTFNTGNKSSPGAKIPGLLFFDMNRQNGGLLLDVFPEN